MMDDPAIGVFDGIRRIFLPPAATSPYACSPHQLWRRKRQVHRRHRTSAAERARCYRWRQDWLAPTRGLVRHRGKGPWPRQTATSGFVPQQAQLFPWKTLSKTSNYRCCCAASRPRSAGRRGSAKAAALTRFEPDRGLRTPLPSRFPGGMQKRGSIARTLVYPA